MPLLLIGTALRLERGAWSKVQWPRQRQQQSTPPSDIQTELEKPRMRDKMCRQANRTANAPGSPAECALPPFRSRGRGSIAAGRSPGCTACAGQSVAESWCHRQPAAAKKNGGKYTIGYTAVYRDFFLVLDVVSNVLVHYQKYGTSSFH